MIPFITKNLDNKVYLCIDIYIIYVCIRKCVYKFIYIIFYTLYKEWHPWLNM